MKEQLVSLEVVRLLKENGRYNMSIYEHSMFNMFGFDTYERALEAGIKKALKLI